MGRIVIDTHDLRDVAQDLRRTTGAVDAARSSVGAALRGAWLGPGGERFRQDWTARDGYLTKDATQVRNVATGLDQYAAGVDRDQASRTTFHLPVPWVMRPSRVAITLPFLGSIAALFGAFRAAKQLLAEMRRLLERGLRRMLGLLRYWSRIGWSWAKAIAGFLQGAGNAVVGVGALAGAAILFPFRGVVTDRLWRLYAATVPAVVHRWAAPTWNDLARPGESVLDRSARWIKAAPPEGFAPGEFGIVDRGDGQVLIVMRGLEVGSSLGNSPAEVAWEQMGFGPYSAQVQAELVRLKQKYRNLTVSFVGHSEGGMAARNVVAQNLQKYGIKVGAVVTIDSPVDGRGAGPGVEGRNVYSFDNRNFFVSRLDGDHAPMGQGYLGTRVQVPTDKGHDVDQFVGGAYMTPEQKAQWDRAGALLQDFGTILPSGNVQVYGR